MLSKEKWQWMHALADKVFDIIQGKRYRAWMSIDRHGIVVSITENVTERDAFFRMITNQTTREEFDSILRQLDAFIESPEEESEEGDWDKDFDEMTDAGLADGD